MIDRYGRTVLQEVGLLDRLVSTAYQVIGDFPRFTTACMLYFSAAICCEERYQRGEPPTHLWNADDDAFVAFVEHACALLTDAHSDPFEEIRQGLSGWNTAGLMDDSVSGRYAYTATKGI